MDTAQVSKIGATWGYEISIPSGNKKNGFLSCLGSGSKHVCFFFAPKTLGKDSHFDN